MNRVRVCFGALFGALLFAASTPTAVWAGREVAQRTGANNARIEASERSAGGWERGGRDVFSYFLGQEETFVRARPGKGSGAIELGVKPGRADALWDAATRAPWDVQMPLVDLRGDGRPQEVPWGGSDRWLTSFCGRGAQRLTWTETWADSARMQLYSYEQGLEGPRLVWESEPEPGAYSPYSLVGDFDGDGSLEIAVSRHKGLSVFDGLSGQREATLDYRSEHHRQYGFFGAYPHPSGQGSLFLVVGDFAGHIEVVSCEGGRLNLLWMHLFDPQSEQGITRRFTINRVVPDPVADADGDGRQEALLSVFNESGDGRWHVVGYDLLTGRVAVDLPDRYLSGLADVDGDGRKELFCQVLRNRAEPTYAPLELIRLQAGQPSQVVWRAPRARWNFHHVMRHPLERWCGQTLGHLEVVVRRAPDGGEFYVSLPPSRRGERCEAIRVGRNGRTRRAWRAEGSRGTEIEVCAVGPDQREVLLAARSRGRAAMSFDGARAEVVCARRRHHAAPSMTLASDAQGQPWVIAADVTGRVNFLRVESGRLRRVRELRGRPMSTQGEWAPLGLAAADLDGDGADEVLFAREAPGGGARIVAMGLDGRERWHRDFADFSGRLRAWNMGGITCWTAGRFRSRGRMDVAVSLRRSIMHSDEVYMLDGMTGEIVWRRDALEVKDPTWPHLRGFGGGLMAAADVDGDRLDELVLCYPAELSVTRGATGEVMHVHVMGPVAEIPGNVWVIGGAPLAADLDGDGRPEILWTQNRTLLSAFSLDQGRLRMIWHTEPNQATDAAPAVARLKSGEWVIGAAGFPDGFRALNGRDGGLRWSANIPQMPVSNTVAADVDADGEVEFIFAAGERVYARRADTGAECWTLEVAAPVAQVAVARGGGGRSVILAATGTGELLCFRAG